MKPFTSATTLAATALLARAAAQCPDYLDYAEEYHAPFSSGRYNLSYQRPSPPCRTFNLSEVENTITRLNSTIKDPDLYRLFQNSYPNTLDTAIKWKGYAANNSEEELTFIITGDINAMWLRDSANQMQSYLPLLNYSSSSSSLASLYRGVINLHSRYLLTSPYCNSFQPPVESGIPPAMNGASTMDVVMPNYTNTSVFECKYELDSLAAFLQISAEYYNATNDITFFQKFQWSDAIAAVLSVAEAMMTPTYAANGSVNISPYTFTRQTNRASETLENDGLGNPIQAGTGLIRSAFRPSDDATIFQLFIPANMLFARYLESCAAIMAQISGCSDTASKMTSLSSSLRAAISKNGIVPYYAPAASNASTGMIYAYEVDGYGSSNIMDDANIPSLLSAPFIGYLDRSDPTYLATRSVILSQNNPYFMRGPILSAVGGPHNGPGYAWPMASIVRILTSTSESEVEGELKQLVSSTDGLGLIHESVNSFNESDWTRQWFSWANGLFGQMILDVEDRFPAALAKSYQ